MIGPGIPGISIPPVGWAAVEMILWDLPEALRKLGCTVDVYNNPNLEEVCNEINSKDYDFVQNQYDNHTEVLNRLLKKPYTVTTHYGWINRPQYWDQGYVAINNAILKSPGIIALSEEIANLYRSQGYTGFLKILRNGTDVHKFKFIEKCNSGKAVCVGKIDFRKAQNYIAQVCGRENISVDFVGPKADVFIENDTCKWLGEWDKQTLFDNLTNYNTLILLSQGEASPLVVPESLAAGCSVVISSWSAANMPDKPYITIIDNQEKLGRLPEYIRGSIAANNNYRSEIRQLAEDVFDWNRIAVDYLEIIRQWKEYNK